MEKDAEHRDIATAGATTTFPGSPTLAQQVHIVADLWATTDIALAMALIELDLWATTDIALAMALIEHARRDREQR